MLAWIVWTAAHSVASAQAVTLEEAWRAAEASSPQIAIAAEQRRQMEMMTTQAWATLSPKVSASGKWNLNQYESVLDFSDMIPEQLQGMIEMGDPIVINKKKYFDANVTLTQPLFNARAIPTLFGAYSLAEAGRDQESAARAQIRLGVAKAWWGVRLAREGESLSTAAVDLAKKNEATAKAQEEVGTVTHQTVLQASISVARAERDRVAAISRRIQAEQALSDLTGLALDVALDGNPVPPLPYSAEGEAIERAYTSRPDVQAAMEQLEVARLTVTAARLAAAPTLDARFTEAWTQNAGLGGHEQQWVFSVNANWMVWDGGYRHADTQKSVSQLEVAEQALEKAKLDARAQVRAAWAERERALAALGTVQKEVELAEENLRLAQASLEAGTISFLDAENARMGRDSARLSLVSEQMNVSVATLTLLQATGDL